eukprot:6492286-Amphidinium_carterae.1
MQGISLADFFMSQGQGLHPQQGMEIFAKQVKELQEQDGSSDLLQKDKNGFLNLLTLPDFVQNNLVSDQADADDQDADELAHQLMESEMVLCGPAASAHSLVHRPVPDGMQTPETTNRTSTPSRPVMQRTYSANSITMPSLEGSYDTAASAVDTMAETQDGTTDAVLAGVHVLGGDNTFLL